MRVNFISFVALATTATALLVTSPRIGEKIDPDMPLTIKWQTVATDPDTFTIELVNQNVYPPTTEVVVEDIDSSKGSYTVKAKSFTGVDDGKGYQINFVSPTSGILAQSQQFRVTEPGALASSSGKETSTALETSSASSLMSSTASTSDLTSTPSSNASSYLSSTAHSSTSASTPTSSHYSSASSISTPTTSSLITSSANLAFYLDAYHSHFFFSLFYLYTGNLFLTLFYIYTFNLFFHYNVILHYIHLCYPDYFYFHYHFVYVTYQIHTFHLDSHIKHYLSYIPFYPYFHYPWLHVHRYPFEHHNFDNYSPHVFDYNLHCYGVGNYYH
ncbi:uncharacterized protein N7500_006115 [Penicillium coprophilum]|uniref:uncharacterized protein n=1 Tax=Penicillium coprophilum TaxID=36646 RepID=UPI002392DA5C|nr:uncharacterized protein N7500_006115 [Penicillium coprophilum]KAJ5164285.1 hypothetical protein N7500_006115 [Penicillium coprophilum]